MFDDKST